jgi:hypothetical protein
MSTCDSVLFEAEGDQLGDVDPAFDVAEEEEWVEVAY